MRLNQRRLEGAQQRQFRLALQDAFDLDSFDVMLFEQLDIRRPKIALANSFEMIVHRVIERLEDESRTAELLRGARAARPENAALLEFQLAVVPALQLPPALATRPALQRTLSPHNPAIDPMVWQTQLARNVNYVCRVELAGVYPPTFGTGVLVGPDLVLTCFHVVEPAVVRPALAAQMAVRFDHVLCSDGVTTNPGTPYRLADAWLVDSSPYGPHDGEPASDVPAGPSALDYALLRVADSPGLLPVLGEANRSAIAAPRGWLTLGDEPAELVAGTPLYALHHPDAGVVKLSLEMSAVIGPAHGGSRVRYTVNTSWGSSGAPIFDAAWRLVAIHQLGDTAAPPRFNQGIPTASIRDLLLQRNALPPAAA